MEGEKQKFFARGRHAPVGSYARGLCVHDGNATYKTVQKLVL